MIPQLYEIYEARIRLNQAQYSRPCIVVRIDRPGGCSVFPISSAMELYAGPRVHFKIETTDPDFSKTGLTVDSYIIGERFIPISDVDLLRKRGQIEGELLKRFMKWI